MEVIEFLNNIKRVSSNRVSRIKNSWGVYDAYKYYRKNKPKGKEYILKEVQYFAIIRTINNKLRDLLCNGEDIVLPENMGRLELRKYEPIITLEGNKIKTNLPIDWDATLKLWYEDKESFINKTLVRINEKEVFKVLYNKNKAKYNNKSFYQFSVNRELKLQLKKAIKYKNIDAFKVYK